MEKQPTSGLKKDDRWKYKDYYMIDIRRGRGVYHNLRSTHHKVPKVT